MNTAPSIPSEQTEHTIVLQSQNISFPALARHTILESASQHKVNLQKGCVAGICRVCKLKLIAGDIEYRPGATVCLTASEISDNYFLPCCAVARSDIICSTATLAGTAQQQPREGVVVIYKQQRSSVFVLRLKLSRHTQLVVSPGQYIELEAGENVFRAYSVANVPPQDGFIELHVRYRPGGVFSERLKHQIKLNDVLWIRGAYGAFQLTAHCTRPLLLMATGTGFAPLQAMLMSGRIPRDRDIHLYWGARHPEDLYFEDVIGELQSRYERFSFTPVWSRFGSHDRFPGQVGYVQRCAQKALGDLSHFAVYACGSPQMIQEALAQFTTTAGLPAEQFHSDAFYGCA